MAQQGLCRMLHYTLRRSISWLQHQRTLNSLKVRAGSWGNRGDSL